MTQRYSHFLILALVSFAVFFPSLLFPYLEIDELIWGEMANSMVEGCAPYTCVVGGKMPLLYLFYAGVFEIFGKNNYFFAHLIHILWVALAAWILTRVPTDRPRLSFGVFYIIILGLPPYRNLSPTGESLMNLFLITSWWFFLRNLIRPTFFKGAMVGITIALGSLFRQQAGILLAGFGLWLVVEAFRTKKFKNYFLLILPMVLGWLVIMALTGIGLYAWGSWEGFYRWAIFHNFFYIQSGSPGWGSFLKGMINILGFFGPTLVIWIFFFFGLKARKDIARPLWTTAIFYLASALLAGTTGFRFFPHYFFQAAPPLAVLASYGWDQVKQSHLAKFGLALSLLFVFGENMLVGDLRLKDSTLDYAPLNQIVGNYIKENSKPEDKIFVWGWGHGIYYFSNRG
ncbi:MAG: hypothetical protein R3257_06755, partial [bacterium]|nr:hypothetical protein [bacterium]